MPVEFDDGIKGLEPGAEARVEFPIPDTSSNPDYVGKTAQFDVTVHEIKAKKLPEVDDAFAGEMGFDTVELMYDDMRSRLDLQRLLNWERAKEKKAREEIARRTPGDIPKPMIESRVSSLETDFARRLEEQGMTLDQYAQMAGLNQETFTRLMAADAEQQVREDLALEALFRALGMEVTDADIDQELEDIAQASKTTAEEARKKWEDMGLMAVLAEGVMHRKAVGWLMENVKTVEVEEAEEGAEPSAPAEGTKKTTKKRASKKKAETEVAEDAAGEAADEAPAE
jgi:trigger factor